MFRSFQLKVLPLIILALGGAQRSNAESVWPDHMLSGIYLGEGCFLGQQILFSQGYILTGGEGELTPFANLVAQKAGRTSGMYFPMAARTFYAKPSEGVELVCQVLPEGASVVKVVYSYQGMGLSQQEMLRRLSDRYGPASWEGAADRWRVAVWTREDHVDVDQLEGLTEIPTPVIRYQFDPSSFQHDVTLYEGLDRVKADNARTNEALVRAVQSQPPATHF